jgi:hypothetical protein
MKVYERSMHECIGWLQWCKALLKPKKFNFGMGF